MEWSVLIVPGILLAALMARLLIYRWRNRRVLKFMASIPGPTCIPFFGNAYLTLRVNNTGIHQTLRQLSKEYPRAVAIWVLGEPYLLTADRQVFNALSLCSQNINKTSDYDPFKFHCTAIFTANGSEWRKIRRIINPSFRTKVLMSFGPAFSCHTKTLLQRLQSHADTGCYFDILTPVHSCTIDMICENMMGCSMNIQNRNLVSLSTNLERSTEMCFEKSFSFMWWSDTIYSLFGKKKRLLEAVKGMRDLAHQMLQQKLESENITKLSTLPLDSCSGLEDVEKESLSTFMDLLLDNIKLGAITKDQAVEEIVEMFIAGSITTATTVAWMTKILATRPDIQAQLHEEIHRVQKMTETDTNQEDLITLGQLSQFQYLDMVVKETLRHVTVPFVLRHLSQDLTLEDGRVLPAGLRVMLNTFSLHHDPEYWEQPSEFYPSHFSPEKETARPKGVFLPFMCGPRICPGNKYATQSIKLLMASMIKKYEFFTEEKPCQDFLEEEYRIMFMLWPTSGFNVQIKNRSKTVRIAQNG
nr:PREDICTED: probable cytochrome P450 4d14 [Bemisia tabaci]XP_018903448.1 PREDICTED: probable cytochrome P450 4d14 [Bemisia tabaci]